MTQVLTNLYTFAKRFLLICPIFLTACTIGPWEKEFWSPPAAHGAAPIQDGSNYPIQRATGETDAKWPKLGEVPDRPNPPLTEQEIATQMEQLEKDRQKATTLKETIENKED